MPPRPGTSDPDLWIVDLPAAKDTSAGTMAGVRVAADGATESVRENEDRYYTCRFEAVQLYLVLDGHNGSRACEFAKKKIPSILLQRDVGANGERAAEALRHTFNQTERDFFLMLDQYITRKMVLQMEMQEEGGTTSLLAYSMFPEKVEELQRLEEQISGGTTAVVAFIHDNRYLWVANVGDSRAILCYLDREGTLHAEQISEDHNTKNQKEIARLEECGLDGMRLRSAGRLGVHQNTRSIGDYSIKGGYKDHDILSTAIREPGIADPFISHPPLDIASVRGFLLLMSDGLYDALAAVTKSPQTVNHDLALLVQRHLDYVASLDEVAEKVIAEVSTNFRSIVQHNHESARMDDITLIVRNLGYPLGQISRNMGTPASMMGTRQYENSQFLHQNQQMQSMQAGSVQMNLPYYTSPEVAGEGGGAVGYGGYTSPGGGGGGGEWQHTTAATHQDASQYHQPPHAAVYENWDLEQRRARETQNFETATATELGSNFGAMNIGGPQQMNPNSWQSSTTNADPQFQQQYPGQPPTSSGGGGGTYTNATVQQTGMMDNNAGREPEAVEGDVGVKELQRKSSTLDADAKWMYNHDDLPNATPQVTGETVSRREEQHQEVVEEVVNKGPGGVVEGEEEEEYTDSEQRRERETTDVAELELAPDPEKVKTDITKIETKDGMIIPMVKFDKFPLNLSWDEI